MNTFALSSKALKAVESTKPSLEWTREMLRQYQDAEARLEAECKKRNMEKPKLVAE